MIKYVPNCLTITRFFAPFILSFLLDEKYYLYAILICLFSSFTDFLDGYIARKYHCQTQFGSIIDPIADKFFITYTIIYFYSNDFIPFFLALIIIFRDFCILIGASICYFKDRKVKFSPLYISKMNTALQMAFIIVIIFGAYINQHHNAALTYKIFINVMHFIKWIFVILISLTTCVSGIQYLMYFVKFMKKK